MTRTDAKDFENINDPYHGTSVSDMSISVNTFATCSRIVTTVMEAGYYCRHSIALQLFWQDEDFDD